MSTHDDFRSDELSGKLSVLLQSSKVQEQLARNVALVLGGMLEQIIRKEIIKQLNSATIEWGY